MPDTENIVKKPASKGIEMPIEQWPYYEDDEIQAAIDILKSGKTNYWGGKYITEFEEACASRFGTEYAIALANGSCALDLALKALNIGVGDEVIVTPRSFIASVACVILAGATPVFADIDRNSGNITPDTIACCITPRTKAIIPVHLAGWPCDMEGIMRLAREHELFIVEDCAQAHGAEVNGLCVGSFGDFGCFSFCQDKILSTGGEGGLLTTNDRELWEKAWSFKDHGKGYRATHTDAHPPGFRWLHNSFGTNWRLTEFQAAIGLRQLAKLERWLERRRRNANRFIQALSRYPAIRLPLPPEGYFHVYYRLYFYVNLQGLRSAWDHGSLREALRAEGLPVADGSCSEIYLEKAFDDRPDLVPQERLPNASEMTKSALSVPVHHRISDESIEHMIALFDKVLSRASRS